MTLDLLGTIRSPQDLKKLALADLPQLAKEVRQAICDQVSKTGGHLAPNLGVVELTEPARVAVPGGHVNAAGGSYIHEGAALSLDTRLGELSLGARYSSGWGWMFGSDVRIEQGYLRDATGARIALSALADGALLDAVLPTMSPVCPARRFFPTIEAVIRSLRPKGTSARIPR